MISRATDIYALFNKIPVRETIGLDAEPIVESSTESDLAEFSRFCSSFQPPQERR